MARRSYFALSIMGLAVSLGSCSSPAPVTPDESCTRHAQAQCERIDACARWQLEELYGDVATCVARYKLWCLAEVGAPGTSRTAEHQAACADAVAKLSCDDWLYDFTAKTGDVCSLKSGTLATGQPCARNSQCASTYCKKGETACGVCA